MKKAFENLLAINRNANGDYYFLYSVPQVKRGIRGKSKAQVDEVLIIGVPKAKLVNYLRAELRENDMEMFYVEGTKEELRI